MTAGARRRPLLADLPREAVAAPGFWHISPPVPVVARPERAAGAVHAGNGSWGAAGELRELLGAIPNAGKDELGYDEWFSVVAAVHHETSGSEEGRALAHEFSARSGKYSPGFLDERVWPYVHSEGRGEGGVVGLGTLRRLAGRWGWPRLHCDDFEVLADDRPPLPAEEVPTFYRETTGDAENCRESTEKLPPGAVQVSRADTVRVVVKRRGIPEAHYLTTDLANANRLVRAFGRMVFVAAGRWHCWDGRRWVEDEGDVARYACKLSDLIREEARAIRARAAASGALDLAAGSAAAKKAAAIAEALDKWALRSEMKGAIDAALGLMRKMLTVEAEALNRDPWLFNVANGTVDLRTGDLRGHDPADMITRMSPVRYVPEAQAPLWERVVREIMGEESSGAPGGARGPLVGFLQRWWGYCLTAHTREKKFVVHHGVGDNGKSLVIGVQAEIMGDYAGTGAPGLLVASRVAGHPTEIADLFGRRMVVAHETGENVVLREDFVKQATGGDRLKARHMREDFFEWAPTHKLQLLTNHKPQIKGTDAGIWSRVALLPYAVSWGTEEQVRAGERERVADRGLMDRVRGELEGVLAWAVRGAVEWAREGLRVPAAVLDASATYQGEQDRLAQFVRECCELGPVGSGMEEPLTEGMGAGLYPAFVGWCKEGGVFPVSKRRFLDEVLRVVPGGRAVDRVRRAEDGRRRQVTMIQGIRLLPE